MFGGYPGKPQKSLPAEFVRISLPSLSPRASITRLFYDNLGEIRSADSRAVLKRGTVIGSGRCFANCYCRILGFATEYSKSVKKFTIT